MMKLAPERIYATIDILDMPAARERTERMIAAMDAGSVEWVSMEELDEVAASGRWSPMPYWGEMAERRDPDLVLTTAKFLPPEEEARMRERYPNLRGRDLYGFTAFDYRTDGDPEFRERSKGVICTSAWELRTIIGCPFRCAYCSLGTVNRILVNIEEYVEHLDELFTRIPAQRLYKWDNRTDIPCFEPEYDASRPLVDRFARESDRYLEVYVGKSADTDYLLDYHHAGRTILQWSVCGRSQQELFEEKTDTPTERLRAARRCQEAGYIVRFRLSPIIPVKGWREENRALIEEMFALTQPDVVSLCPFGWRDVSEAERALDFDLLDEEFVAAMRSAAPFLRKRGYSHGGARPIPHDARYVMLEFLIDEIQRVSPQTTIALCLETEEMWRALGERIGQRPEAFVCNCGPQCTPGGALYEKQVGQR